MTVDAVRIPAGAVAVGDQERTGVVGLGDERTEVAGEVAVENGERSFGDELAVKAGKSGAELPPIGEFPGELARGDAVADVEGGGGGGVLVLAEGPLDWFAGGRTSGARAGGAACWAGDGPASAVACTPSSTC